MAELEAKFPEATVDLLRSGGGRFEVTVDGVPVYQKSKTGQLPHPGEVTRAIEELNTH
jgi:selT/selW/selH-like putative selenoprotein